MPVTSGKFAFRRNMTVGAPDAEQDGHFLEDCFVDTGDLEILRACDNPKSLIVARTGTGKTALLHRLKQVEKHVIEVSPFALSVEHISNSALLRFFAEIGTNFDLFYKLLWRHVFTVEIIREKYHIYSQDEHESFLQRILPSFLKDKKRKAQIEYLLNHGGPFWKDTEVRVKEATQRTETDLHAGMKKDFPLLSVDIGAARKLSAEEKSEIRQLGQEVVSRIKIRDLNEMFDLLANGVLDDDQQHFYIVLDGLDENWVDDDLRYPLIKALIETIREFGRVPSVKIIVCLRTDLIQRVLKRTRSAGFQEEKIQGMYLQMQWSRKELIEMLDRRIAKVARDTFTTAIPKHSDLLPTITKVGAPSAIQYILDRTFLRPRDVIAFFNCCMTQAVGSPKITKDMLSKAEGDYSSHRLRSLGDEWSADAPELLDFVSFFKRRTAQFRLGSLTSDEISAWCLDCASKASGVDGVFTSLCRQFFDGECDDVTFRQMMAYNLYRMGFLGIKTEGFQTVHYSSPDNRTISSSSVNDDCLCQIHPMYWAALGVILKH